MITQISSMEFKKNYHCYDVSDAGVDSFGYQRALGILTDDLRDSAKSNINSSLVNHVCIVFSISSSLHYICIC
jgi:hypothetical protein